jgi:hypothetical protein
VYMITVILPLSAQVIMALLLVIFWLICFRMCNCLLCVVFWWLVLYSCFSFLVGIMRNGLCSLSSRSLMARSVSRTRFVQVDFVDLCMLYWSPRSSSFWCSSVNCMPVKLMVHGYVVGCLLWGLCIATFCFSSSLSSFLFSLL